MKKNQTLLLVVSLILAVRAILKILCSQWMMLHWSYNCGWMWVTAVESALAFAIWFRLPYSRILTLTYAWLLAAISLYRFATAQFLVHMALPLLSYWVAALMIIVLRPVQIREVCKNEKERHSVDSETIDFWCQRSGLILFAIFNFVVGILNMIHGTSMGGAFVHFFRLLYFGSSEFVVHKMGYFKTL